MIWLRVVTEDGRLGWLRQIRTMPARTPAQAASLARCRRTRGGRHATTVRHARPAPARHTDDRPRPMTSLPPWAVTRPPRSRSWTSVRSSLEGRLVRLEPLAARHVEALVEPRPTRRSGRWTVEANDTPELVRAHLERAIDGRARTGPSVAFATVERATGAPVGCTRFLSIDRVNRHLEIGWTWLSPRLQGRGYNDEAKLLQLTHAFERLGCHRVEFKTDSLNERSRGALAGIGATFEGIFRNHMIMPGGRLRHSAWYSVIDEEWPRVKAHLEARGLEGRLSPRRGGPGLAHLEDAVAGLGRRRAHDDLVPGATPEQRLADR